MESGKRMTVSALDLEKLCNVTARTSMPRSIFEKRRADKAKWRKIQNEIEKRKNPAADPSGKNPSGLKSSNGASSSSACGGKDAKPATAPKKDEKRGREDAPQQLTDEEKMQHAAKVWRTVQNKNENSVDKKTSEFRPPSRRGRQSQEEPIPVENLSCECTWKYDGEVGTWLKQHIEQTQRKIVCAPFPVANASGLRIFDEIQPGEGANVQDYEDWHESPKWVSLLKLLIQNTDQFRKIGTGTSNVLYKKNLTNWNFDPDHWPPQFEYSGLPTDGFALPGGAKDPAIRVTRRFANSDSPRGFVTSDQIREEMAYMLYFALVGVGPPIYALYKFPYNAIYPGDPRNWGSLAVMQRGTSLETFLVQNALNERLVHMLSKNLMCCCKKMASCGFVDFDTKPNNFIVTDTQRCEVYRIDFDSLQTHKVQDDTLLTSRGRYFIHLFLLAMHFKSFRRDSQNYVQFSKYFLMHIRHELLSLYLELYNDHVSPHHVMTSFGAAATAFFTKQFSFDEKFDNKFDCRDFDPNMLTNLKPIERLVCHFTMMVSYYFYNTKVPDPQYKLDSMFNIMNATPLASYIRDTMRLPSFKIIPFFVTWLLDLNPTRALGMEIAYANSEMMANGSALAGLL